MRIIENTLYLEFSELIECGISDNTIKSAIQRQSWHFIQHPDDRRKVLIGYEDLKKRDNYRSKIETRFGNVYEYVAKMPIKALVEKDHKAEAYYMTYRFNGSQMLPVEHVKKYVVAASWLNMLVKFNQDKKQIKKLLNLTVDKFYEHVCEIIKTDSISLPATYQRLVVKRQEYEAEGYECLISGKFGNKAAAKIGKTEEGFNEELAEKQIAIIRKAASLHNNFDAMQVTRAANIIFSKNGWPEVSHGTVYNVMKANGHITMPGARGQRAYNNEIAMQVKRRRPQFPLQYFTLDGWTVELLYQDKGSYNNRLVVVVILDAMNNYPVGYAIGERENAELIKEANRNALLHIQELFGNTYRPWQLQSDHYALKTLTPFYEAMSHLHTPAAVGNAKSKVIEPYFKDLNKNYCQRHWNWSGFNITSSKKNQVNAEMLDKVKQSLPNKEAVINQIHAIFYQERSLKCKQYMQQWQACPDEEKALLNREDRLMIFGTPTGYTNSITGAGLTPTICGQLRYYDTFDPNFRALQHLSFQVIYDKDDPSAILAISEDNKHRFVLNEKRMVAMDIRSASDADHQYLSEVRAFNKARREEIIETYVKDAEIVEKVIAHTPLALDDYNEATLKLMFTHKGQQKEKLQDAKGLKATPAPLPLQPPTADWQAVQTQYLQSKTDFNQYLD